MMSLGEFIKNQRDKIGLSQEGLGRFVDISQKQISNIESDYIKQPHRNTLKKMAKALDCSYEKLLQLAGYETHWQEAEILIDDKPLDEKIEEIVEKIVEKNSSKTIEEIQNRMDRLERKLSSSSLLGAISTINVSGRKIPFLHSGLCGPAENIIPEGSETLEIPANWDVDFAFLSKGQSMESHKVFDNGKIFVKNTGEALPEDISVIHVNGERENHLIVRKCKGDRDNKIFLDSNGNIFKIDKNTTIIGKVVKVLIET